MAAAHQNTTVEPCTAASAWATGGGVPAAGTKSPTALAKTVESSATPSDPPTCCEVFTSADATPASPSATPYVAVGNDGAMIIPNPTPLAMIPGRTAPAYEEPASIPVR
jgi:hypothetical protein